MSSFVTIDPRTIVFPPGSLTVAAVYSISVSAWMRSKPSLINTIGYKIRVLPAGVTAAITGSSYRRLTMYERFDLSAAASVDLDGLTNVPFTYTWTCLKAFGATSAASASGSLSFTEPCTPGATSTTVYGSDAVLTVADPRVFGAGVYQFTVVAAKGEHGAKLPASLRSSAATAEVELVDATIPTVDITLDADVLSSVNPNVINIGSKPIITAHVSSSTCSLVVCILKRRCVCVCA